MAQGTTTRVSVGPGAAQADQGSGRPAISADGRWVAFQSIAENLVTDDSNGRSDVFVYDRQAGLATRVSLDSSGVQGNNDSTDPRLSADGRWVTFTSLASNLVPGDTNSASDVFVHDRQTGDTSRVNVGAGGTQANDASSGAVISADGRWVVFQSDATNLVAGDTNQASDVFLHDRHTGTTSRISVGVNGAQGNGASDAPAISADGIVVAFASAASNLVVGDSNRVPDVFVHDRATGLTTRVSVGAGGTQANDVSTSPWLSADGRWVVFKSVAANLVANDTNHWSDVFVRDREAGTTTRVNVGAGGTQANGFSDFPVVSANGRWVAFESAANNLVAADANDTIDVFVHDRLTGVTTLASVGASDARGNALSERAAISVDGGLLAFVSQATNLAPDDTNGVPDVFVHDRGVSACAVTLASRVIWAPASEDAGTVLVMAPADCAWMATSNDPWLSIIGGTAGAGFATLHYRAAENAGAPRTGTLTIGGQPVTVTQASPTIPMAPENLSVASVAANLVILTWTAPSFGPQPTSFVVEGGADPGAVQASLATRSTVPALVFLAPIGSFHVRVHAINGSLRSAASNEIRLHVNVAEPPSAPAQLTGLVNGTSAALAWTNTFAGGAPTSLLLDVTGAVTESLPLPLTETVSVAGMPPGTYTLALRGVNAAGSSAPSNAVTLAVPGNCSGTPGTATNVRVVRLDRTIYLAWAPSTAGPAPQSYIVQVTGSWTGRLPTSGGSWSGVVPPGSYTLSVLTVNECGEGPGTDPQTIVVP